MLGMACQYDPQQHELLDPELIRWCRREARTSPSVESKSLFCYRHHKWDTFVIALWVGSGRFVDILNLGESLANFSHSVAKEFLRRVHCPTTAEETRKFLREAESNHLHEMQDEDYRQTYERERRIRDAR